MQLLAGLYDKKKPAAAKPEEGDEPAKPEVDAEPISLLTACSYKRQDNAPKYRRYTGTVRQLLERNVSIAFTDTMFKLFVMRPLRMEELMEFTVANLSGGELQRLAIVVCLGTPAMVYLIDEPSAGLD